jgi:hypothetical protein
MSNRKVADEQIKKAHAIAGKMRRGEKLTPKERAVWGFGELAGRIVDNQIVWEPGQQGRWELAFLPNSALVIEFHDFPDDTILTLKSLNGTTVRLGLKAAAAAISQCAMGWNENQACEAGLLEVGKRANVWFHKITQFIHGRNGNFTHDERRFIYRYND